MRALANTVAAGWPLLASLTVAAAGQRLASARRRVALNRALHELRRPLHALALSVRPKPSGSAPGPFDLILAALADLDREINGGATPRRAAPHCCHALVAAAVGRWRARAALAGARIELRWRAGSAVAVLDAPRVSQALDNLIVNALEHGGPNVMVDCAGTPGRLRITVADDGVAARPPGRREAPAQTIARLTGARRRGHGLAVVRAVAREHGGRFALNRREDGSTAVLELPVFSEAGFAAA